MLGERLWGDDPLELMLQVCNARYIIERVIESSIGQNICLDGGLDSDGGRWQVVGLRGDCVLGSNWIPNMAGREGSVALVRGGATSSCGGRRGAAGARPVLFALAAAAAASFLEGVLVLAVSGIVMSIVGGPGAAGS